MLWTRTALLACLAALSLGGAASAASYLADLQRNAEQIRQLPNTSEWDVDRNLSAQRQFDLAVVDLNAQRYREAALRLNLLLQQSPDDAVLLTTYGLALEGLEQWTPAEQAFTQALSHAHGLPKEQLVAQRDRGVVRAKLGRAAQAQADLDALQQRALACSERCEQADDLRGAVDEVQRAIAAGPGG